MKNVFVITGAANNEEFSVSKKLAQTTPKRHRTVSLIWVQYHCIETLDPRPGPPLHHTLLYSLHDCPQILWMGSLGCPAFTVGFPVARGRHYLIRLVHTSQPGGDNAKQESGEN